MNPKLMRLRIGALIVLGVLLVAATYLMFRPAGVAPRAWSIRFDFSSWGVRVARMIDTDGISAHVQTDRHFGPLVVESNYTTTNASEIVALTPPPFRTNAAANAGWVSPGNSAR